MRYGRYWRLRHAIALGLVALFLPAAVLAQTRPSKTGYTIIDLGTLGGNDAAAQDINDRGQIVGTSEVEPNYSHAFLWSVETGMVDLNEFVAWEESFATDINEHGQVVGASSFDGLLQYPFLWSAKTGMINLGSISGMRYNAALALNDQGQVVGRSQVGRSDQHAFLWSAQTGITDLGTLVGTQSIAYGINERGQVVGRSEMADWVSHAFLWSAETGMRDLGAFDSNVSDATALNKHGQVAGWNRTADGQPHAFTWSEQIGMRDLGTLGGWSKAVALNDWGQVVGGSTTSIDGAEHAFLWSAGTGMIDLGTLGGTYSSATALNERGQVVGWSETAAGNKHAFVWSTETDMIDLGTLDGTESSAVAVNERGQIVGRSTDRFGRGRAVLWNPRNLKLSGLNPAQISIILRPNPNRETCGDGIVTYTIEIANRGEGNADNTFITLPLDPAKVRVLDAQMDHPGAWVSSLSPTMLMMETGLLAGQGDAMTATVRLVTAGDIPDGTIIDQRLEYRWIDEAGGGSNSSNRVTLTKGGSDMSQEVYPLVAEGRIDLTGGTLHFSSAIFAPNEVVAVWFNKPDGTVAEGGFIRADGEGAISVPVALADFAHGFYGIVARGSWTQFTALGLFEIH